MFCKSFAKRYIFMKLCKQYHKTGYEEVFLIIPPANEVAGVYSDPHVRPFVRPSVHPLVRPAVPISNPLLL